MLAPPFPPKQYPSAYQKNPNQTKQPTNQPNKKPKQNHTKVKLAVDAAQQSGLSLLSFTLQRRLFMAKGGLKEISFQQCETLILFNK